MFLLKNRVTIPNIRFVLFMFEASSERWVYVHVYAREYYRIKRRSFPVFFGLLAFFGFLSRW